MFPPGCRPDGAAVRSAIRETPWARISHDPGETGKLADWLELLVDGLSFDLLGLAPGPGLRAVETRHLFGLANADLGACEAIGLAVGPHLASAANVMPVVRTQLRIGAALAARWDETTAALWQPAASAMGRGLFIRAIDGWLEGGAFPALGLVGVAEEGGGGLASDGLSFFTGQELSLAGALCEDRVAATRLLLRLVDRLVEHGPVTAPERVPLADGSFLRLVPRGSIVRVDPD